MTIACDVGLYTQAWSFGKRVGVWRFLKKGLVIFLFGEFEKQVKESEMQSVIYRYRKPLVFVRRICGSR